MAAALGGVELTAAQMGVPNWQIGRITAGNRYCHIHNQELIANSMLGK